MGFFCDGACVVVVGGQTYQVRIEIRRLQLRCLVYYQFTCWGAASLEVADLALEALEVVGEHDLPTRRWSASGLAGGLPVFRMV
jgi:hypothetical protein